VPLFYKNAEVEIVLGGLGEAQKLTVKLESPQVPDFSSSPSGASPSIFLRFSRAFTSFAGLLMGPQRVSKGGMVANQMPAAEPRSCQAKSLSSPPLAASSSFGL
jgi:hypothetical protein